MNVGDLPNAILMFVFIGMLVGIGALTFISTGDSVRDEITIAAENHTLENATAVSLNNTEIKEVTQILNGTNIIPSADYIVNEELGQIILINNDYDALGVNISYVDYVDTTATTAFDSLSTAITPITSTWMSLIVVVVILTIIIGMVMSSFGRAR